MIQHVSMKNNAAPSFKQNYNKTKKDITPKINQAKQYADSFVKHSKQSVPVLLGMTAIWSSIDKSTRKIPFKKAFVNNIKGFFLPVIIASSALLAFIENKKSPEDKKQLL